MSDIAALEGRITAALDRIRSGLDGIATPTHDAGSDELAAQLADEKTANAQLVERVRALKDAQDGKMADLEHRVAAQGDQMSALDAELQRLRASNADLREVNAQLRAAAADGVGDAEMINRAMMAEIDALAAQRGADVAEVNAILAELTPLIKEA